MSTTGTITQLSALLTDRGIHAAEAGYAVAAAGTFVRSSKRRLFMHLFNTATLFVVLTLVGVEFSVSAFVNPAAWQLEPEAQLKMLSRFALVLGRVMPVWYPVSTLLFAIETWLYWHTPGRAILLTAVLIWVFTSVISIFFLVPLNTRVAEGAADWQPIHRLWDRRHRVRIAALSTAAVLLTYFVVR
jgi:uncharacterized membrane protein